MIEMKFINDEYKLKENGVIRRAKLTNIVQLRVKQDGMSDIEVMSANNNSGLKEQIVVVRVDEMLPRLASDDEVGEIFDHIGWQWKNYRELVKDGARIFIQSDNTKL